MWFTKSDDYTFNLDSVRVPAKYPGKKHFKGPNKGKYSGNPNGKNPSDIWEIVLNDWENEIWNIPNVKANHVEKTEHPCQYPIELVGRCVLALTDEDDWVLDPFAGVGSTLLASLKNDRNVIGIEKLKKYRDIGEGSIKNNFFGVTPSYARGRAFRSNLFVPPANANQQKGFPLQSLTRGDNNHQCNHYAKLSKAKILRAA